MTDLTPLPLTFEPGVVKDRTRRANEFGWWDTDLVRFVEGLPQTIGGWSKPFATAMTGAIRSLFGWIDLDGLQLMGIGTYAKYYTEAGGTIEDITPIRRTAALGANPITTSAGSGIITITDTGHGAAAGDFVTLSGATLVNAITAASINVEHEILTTTVNTYTVNTGGTASANGSGGGAGVTATYQLSAGLDTTVVGAGYGAGTWGRDTWDSIASTTAQGAQLRVWTQDNWGEDLVFNPRGGAIYYYDRSSPARGVNLDTLPGASDVPLFCDQVMVASESRHLLAFGTNALGSTSPDSLVWRWPDQETLTDWTPSSTNTAGGLRFLIGSRFMQAVKTRQEILAFTDAALYSVQYVGEPDIFTQRLISPNVKIAGPKAAGYLGDSVFWMGTRGFHFYNGQTGDIPCPLKEFVYRDINLYQLWKVHCAVNTLYNEVWWFYCSAGSEEIDRYVMVKVPEMTWANGTLPRTAWLDAGTFTLPRGGDLDGYIYDHETGSDDGSTTPPSALLAFAESSPFAMANGVRAVRIHSIWPDLDFLDSSAATPAAAMVLKLQNRPGAALHDTTNSSVSRIVTAPIQQFTDKVDIGKRGRFMSFRIESSATGVQWRMGTPTLILRPDGRR